MAFDTDSRMLIPKMLRFNLVMRGDHRSLITELANVKVGVVNSPWLMPRLRLASGFHFESILLRWA